MNRFKIHDYKIKHCQWSIENYDVGNEIIYSKEKLKC